ncbi:Fic family protein [Gemmatimonadota bacterium]
MFRWTITDEIRANLSRIADQKQNILTRGVLPRRWAGRLRREMESASVAASTSMEGATVTSDEVRHILAGDRPSAVSKDHAQLVEGYRNAISFAFQRADDDAFTWQTELILGIHDRVLAGSHEAGAGSFRTGQVHVTDAEEGQLIYTPPPPEAVPELISDLAVFAKALQPSIEPPVLAALVHIRLVGILPFADGNGRTARILAGLAMYLGGYTTPEFTSLEEYWGAHLEDYYASFSCLGEAWDSGAEVTPFIVAHTGALRLQVDALSLRLATAQEIWTILEDIAIEDLSGPPRFADALFDAFLGREVSNRYYRNLTDVSIATATNDLRRLEVCGLLTAVGAGRTRTYTGTHALMARVANLGSIEQAPVDPDIPLDRSRQAIIEGLTRRISVAE